MHSVPSGEEQLLRQRVGNSGGHGEIVTEQTAQAIAMWFAMAIGPGFRAFLVRGLVSRQFYRELGYLYEQLEVQGQERLDALVRYSLRQPVAPDPGSPGKSEPEDPRQVNGTDIAGYLFCSEPICPHCIQDLLIPFNLDGGLGRTTEEMLDQIAAKLGIRRYDVTSYSVNEFPKPIYKDKISGDEVCALCGRPLNRLSDPA